jgi:hypothetical protein
VLPEAGQLRWTSFSRSASLGQASDARLARKNHEEAFTCNSPDLIAGLGANETVIQGRNRASRQLCADRPDRRRQTGLFDEMRQSAGATRTAIGITGNKGPLNAEQFFIASLKISLKLSLSLFRNFGIPIIRQLS